MFKAATAHEKFSIGVFVFNIIIYIWFYNKISSDWALIPLGKFDLGAILATWVVIWVIVSIVLAAISRGGEKYGRQGDLDERETQQEVRGDSNGYFALNLGVGIIIVQMLIEQEKFSGSYLLSTPVGMVFALVTVLTFAMAVQYGSIIWMARR
ncbi:MAG: hypothetical protein V3V13_08630 [Paracoccaceae bacterium]